MPPIRSTLTAWRPALLGLALLATTACSESGPTNPESASLDSDARKGGKKGPPIASLAIEESVRNLGVGESHTFVAVARDKRGRPVQDVTVAWSTNDDDIAGVSATGLVEGVHGGDAVITASAGGLDATAEVRVTGWALLGVAPESPNLGSTSTFDPVARDVYLVGISDNLSEAPRTYRYSLEDGSWDVIPGTSRPFGKYRQHHWDGASNRILTYWDGLGPVHGLDAGTGAWSPLGGGGEGQEYYEGGSFVDPANGRLSVLMGYGFGTHKNTFWQFDGTAWQLRGTSGATPPARMATSVTVDASGSRVLMAGGHLNVSFNYSDLWQLDLLTATWTNLLPQGTGPHVVGSFGGYDPVADRLYQYGGVQLTGDATSSTLSATLWSTDLSSATVAQVPTNAGPGARRTHLTAGMAYDAPERRFILAGGYDGAAWHFDVWAYYLPQ